MNDNIKNCSESEHSVAIVIDVYEYPLDESKLYLLVHPSDTYKAYDWDDNDVINLNNVKNLVNLVLNAMDGMSISLYKRHFKINTDNKISAFENMKQIFSSNLALDDNFISTPKTKIGKIFESKFIKEYNKKIKAAMQRGF